MKVDAEASQRSAIRSALLDSARFHARGAVTDFVSEDRNVLRQASVSVGVAVELLAKAFIATVEPALLADRGDRDSILAFSGKAHLAAGNLIQAKSISAADSMKVTRHLLPSLPGAQTSDYFLLSVRNAATHMALIDLPSLRRAVEIMCRIVEGLLAALEVSRSDFWGASRLTVVDEILDAAADELHRVVAAKLGAARQTLSRLTRGLDGHARAIVVASLSGRIAGGADHDERQSCPVCDQQGWLNCYIERGEVEYDGSVGECGVVYVTRTAHPFAFGCPVCQLELEGDELEEFDFPRTFDLEPDDDPWEAHQEYSYS